MPITEAAEEREYRAANGARIPDRGGKKVRFRTADGETKSMAFRVAPVTKALASVSRICKQGNRVVFDAEGSFIQNKSTGKKMNLKAERGVYVIEIPIDSVLNGPGFVGQGK